MCYRHNVFINDGASDDEDIPVAENIYSDASSDTESSDDDDSDYSISSYPSLESLRDELHEPDFLTWESIVGIENSQNNCPRVEETRPIPTESSAFADKPSPAPSKKFKKAVPRSRQGVGKKKARRIENGKLIILVDNFIPLITIDKTKNKNSLCNKISQLCFSTFVGANVGFLGIFLITE